MAIEIRSEEKRKIADAIEMKTEDVAQKVMLGPHPKESIVTKAIKSGSPMQKSYSQPYLNAVVCSYIDYFCQRNEQKDDSEEPDTVVYSDRALCEDVAQAEAVQENIFTEEEGEGK